MTVPTPGGGTMQIEILESEDPLLQPTAPATEVAMADAERPTPAAKAAKAAEVTKVDKLTQELADTRIEIELLKKQRADLEKAGKKEGDKEFDTVQNKLYDQLIKEVDVTLELAERSFDPRTQKGSLAEFKGWAERATRAATNTVEISGRKTLDVLADSSFYRGHARLIVAEALAIKGEDGAGNPIITKDGDFLDAARENLKAAKKDFDFAKEKYDDIIKLAKKDLDTAKTAAEKDQLAKEILFFTALSNEAQAGLDQVEKLAKQIASAKP